MLLLKRQNSFSVPCALCVAHCCRFFHSFFFRSFFCWLCRSSHCFFIFARFHFLLVLAHTFLRLCVYLCADEREIEIEMRAESVRYLCLFARLLLFIASRGCHLLVRSAHSHTHKLIQLHLCLLIFPLDIDVVVSVATKLWSRIR